jgi:sorting and assembly machinery component 37
MAALRLFEIAYADLSADELPAVKNGTTLVSRFRNIVDYLRQYSNGAWDLDRDLSGFDRADNIA